MGELDLVSSRLAPTSLDGLAYALLTVFVTWLPLAVAGIALRRTRVVHATMRGAGLLRVLARLAIAVLMAAVAIPLLIAATLVVDATHRIEMSLSVSFLVLAIGLCIMVPVAALSAAGIRGWHQVLADL